MAAPVFTRSTPPFGVPMVGQDGQVSPQWRMYFSQLQTLINSLQERWQILWTSGINVINANDFYRIAPAGEYQQYVIPVGSRIMVRESGNLVKGTMTAVSYDSGTTTLLMSATLDGGVALSSVDWFFYSTLTSSVID